MPANDPIDPTKIYENVKDGVLPVLSATGVQVVASNVTWITSPGSTKKIRILGGFFQVSGATAATVTIKTSTGPVNLINGIVAPANAQFVLLPIVDQGYCETATGDSLTADVSGATVFYFLNYIVYTPS